MREQIEKLLSGATVADDLYVKEALTYLELEFRKICLVLLSDVTEFNLSLRSMYVEIASLQRPSWGCWNGFLLGLLKARRVIINTGSIQQREQVNKATELAWVAGYLEEVQNVNLEESSEQWCQVTKLPLNKIIKKGFKARELLAIPIEIRNRVAHDNISDQTWWAASREVLNFIVQWYGASGIEDHFAQSQTRGGGEPWIFAEAGEVWCYNGMESKGEESSVNYVSLSGKRNVDFRRAGQVMHAFQKILGRQDLQERNFKELLNKLVPEELKGFLLGGYLVGKKTGEGGYAEVFQGVQLSTGRKVALKILKAGLSEIDGARFLQEAEYLSRFDHPNIAGIYEQDEQPWRVSQLCDLAQEPWFKDFKKNHGDVLTYISMEWIEGRTLDEIYLEFKEGRRIWDEKQIAGWFRQAAEALEVIHHAKLIHRDITPKNIMMIETETGDFTIKLMDFGISRTQFGEQNIVTSHGKLLGSEPYMSPEQLDYERARAEVGPPSDLYSLGSTFYELFTKSRLYNHNNEVNSIATASMLKKEGERPQTPKLVNRQISGTISTILEGCLENSQADRYQSAQQLKDDLKHYLNDWPIEYKPPPLQRRMWLFYKRNPLLVNLSMLLVILTIIYVVMVVGERNKALEADTKSKQSLAKMYYKQAEQEIAKDNQRAGMAYLAESLRTDVQPYTEAKLASLLQNQIWPVVQKELPVGSTPYYGDYIIQKEKDKNIKLVDLVGKSFAELASSQNSQFTVVSTQGNSIGGAIPAGNGGVSLKLWDSKGVELPSPQVVIKGSRPKFSAEGDWICLNVEANKYCFYSSTTNEYRDFQPLVEKSVNYYDPLSEITEKDIIVYGDAQRVAYVYGGTLVLYRYNGSSYQEVGTTDLSVYFQNRDDPFADLRQAWKSLPAADSNSQLLMNNHLWLSNDLSKLAVSNAGSFVLLDAQNGKLLLTEINPKHFIHDIAFSSDSSSMAIARGTSYQSGIASAGAGGYISVFDLTTGKETFHTNDNYNTPFTAVQFSVDHSLVLARAMNNNVYIYKAKTGQTYCQPIFTSTIILSVKFTSKGDHVLIEEAGSTAEKSGSSWQGRSKLWSINNAVSTTVAKLDPSIFHVVASPKGNELFTGLNRAIYSLDSENGEVLHKWVAPVTDLSQQISLDINFNSHKILNVCSLKSQDHKRTGYLQVIAEDGSVVSEPEYLEGFTPEEASFSQDGNKFLLLSSDIESKGFLQIWDCSSNKLSPLSKQVVGDSQTRTKFQKACWTLDGKYILAADRQKIYVYEADGSLFAQTEGVNAKGSAVKDMSLSPDGTRLVIASAASSPGDSTAQQRVAVYSLHDLEMGKTKVLSQRNLEASPERLTLSPDGNHLAVACSNGNVIVMNFPDLSDDTSVFEQAGEITDLKFDNTSQFLAVAVNKTSNLNKPEYVRNDSLNRDLQVLRKSSGGYTIWNIQQQQPIFSSPDLNSQVLSIALTKDNRFIFATPDTLYSQWIPLKGNETWIYDYAEMLSGFKVSTNAVLQRVDNNAQAMGRLLPAESPWKKLTSQIIKDNQKNN